jgi:hypothetical protein
MKRAELLVANWTTPNRLRTCAAFTSLGKINAIFGRYANLLGGITRVLGESIYADYEELPVDTRLDNRGDRDDAEAWFSGEPFFEKCARKAHYCNYSYPCTRCRTRCCTR